MPNNNTGRRPKRPTGSRPVSSGVRPVRAVAPSKSEEPELTGLIGWLARNRRLLGWLELIAAIFLLALAVNGFLGGALYIPFAFGLIGLRFFYAYVQHTFGVNFGRTGLVLNLVMLVGALVCAILGLTIENNPNP